MLIALLLQTTLQASQGTPTTVYVTLFAATLAALASLNATRISSKTAREVAALAAQTTQESAKLAAQTAQALKDKDYKNDFYKRIIERRLKAWEEAEKIFPTLFEVLVYRETNEKLPVYCSNATKFDEALSAVRAAKYQSFWLGREYGKQLHLYDSKLVEIRRQCSPNSDELGVPIVDEKLLRQAGIKQFQELSQLLSGLVKISGSQIRVLHDIEDFFQQLDSLNINL